MDRDFVLKIYDTVEAMRANSNAWLKASPTDREKLHQANLDLGKRLRTYGIPAVYCGNDGTWYVGKPGIVQLYDLY